MNQGYIYNENNIELNFEIEPEDYNEYHIHEIN
jgi:hypothetical protein